MRPRKSAGSARRSCLGTCPLAASCRSRSAVMFATAATRPCRPISTEQCAETAPRAPPGPPRADASNRPHPHVGAGRVLDDLELAVARGARRHAAAVVLRYPLVPVRPPRPLLRRGGGEPFVGRSRQLVVRPMAVLAAGRADHAREVPGR